MSRVPGTYRRPKALFVLPSIPDDAPADLKNSLAIRNACATEGRCPACATVGALHPDAHQPLLWHYVFEHENWCEAAA